jgi:hypothetical protein
MKNQRSIKILVFALLLNQNLFSQDLDQLVEAYGQVFSSTGDTVPFLNIYLTNPKDSTNQVLHAAVSDENGNFRMQKIKKGQYILHTQGLGYKDLARSVALNQNTNFGKTVIEENTETLETVTIEAEKPVVEIFPEKTVLNVDQMPTVAGDNSLELLRRAPGVRLDNDENIIVEGRTGTIILINGRRSYLEGDDLKNYLKTLTADDIEAVEIITQPGSKFDAEGSGGVINIKLKRVKGQGLRGSVASTFTYGQRFRNNNALQLSYRSNKWEIGANYGNYFGESAGFIELYRIQGNQIFDDKTNSIYKRQTNSLDLTANYHINDNKKLGIQIGSNYSDFANESNNRTPILGREDLVIDSILVAPNRGDGTSLNLNTNLNYQQKWDNGSEFSADLDLGNYTRDRESLQPNFYQSTSGIELSRQINFQTTSIDVNVFASKLDWSTNMAGGRFSAGGKFSLVSTNNDFAFFDRTSGQDILRGDRSNQFTYDEQIRAGYLDYKRNLWKPEKHNGKELSASIGLRGEQTVSKGDLKSVEIEQNEVVDLNYFNLFPSLGLTYKTDWKNSYTINYSKRVERPSYSDLNPFEYQLNELSKRKGNPFLQPQFIHNFRFSHTYKYRFTTSLSHSYVRDFFAQVTVPEPGGSNFMITRNVAEQQVTNLSVSLPFDLTDVWSLYVNAYGTYDQFIGTTELFQDLSRVSYGGYAQTSYTLSKARNLKFEMSGWYSGPGIWGGTYVTKSLGALNVALAKDWKNWSAKLSVNDILFTSPWRGTTQFDNLEIIGTGGGDSRQVRLNINYTFGHNDVKNVRSGKGSSEEEQKRIQ